MRMPCANKHCLGRNAAVRWIALRAAATVGLRISSASTPTRAIREPAVVEDRGARTLQAS